MNLKKIFNILILSLELNLFNSFAITIVENKPKAVTTSSGIGNIFVGAIFMGLFFGAIVGLIIFIIYFIVKKIKENKRKHSDLLYSKFLIEVEKCHQNRDKNLKYRNWKTFFLTWKRGTILLRTSENGLKIFGKYDGELIEKDNFILLAVYRVTGIFSRDKDIIIIPYELRKLITKEIHNKKMEVIINAESIDEALNTDYYGQIVVTDTKDNDKLINFNEYIQETFMQKYIMRQVIRDNLLDYKLSMDKAVEINPNIQVERKNPKI